jgi:magnesium chelatase family protein
MRPGEISLATNGVLFLDELGEFPVHVLDSLRQPIEEGVVRVARARASTTFPARFLLVAAMNPCPCGEGVMQGGCRCTPAARERYVRRLSGPLLDRFDLQVTVERPSVADLLGTASGEPSAPVAGRVAVARQAAMLRGVACNSMIPSSRLDVVTPLSSEARKLLESRLRSGGLSARGLDRVRRVALTIADLEGVGADRGAGGESGGAGAVLRAEHVAEALVLRAGRDVLTGRAVR